MQGHGAHKELDCWEIFILGTLYLFHVQLMILKSVQRVKV